MTYAELRACIEKIPVPSRIKSEDEEPSLRESLTALNKWITRVCELWNDRQNPALTESCERVIQLLSARHDRYLRALLQDETAIRDVDPEGAIYPVNINELLYPCVHLFALKNHREGEKEPCFHLVQLRDATERLLKSERLRGIHRSPRVDPEANYAVQVAGCFLNCGVEPTTTKNGMYVCALAERLGISESRASDHLASKAIRRAKDLR